MAALIETEGLSPSRIATIFDHSASKTAARDLCLILFAGSVASYRAAPRDWDGTVERDLALNALADLPDPAAAVAMLSAKAAKLIAAR